MLTKLKKDLKWWANEVKNDFNALCGGISLLWNLFMLLLCVAGMLWGLWVFFQWTGEVANNLAGR
jgi:hypothetical protein